MEIIVRITKVNSWTNITKWKSCYDYISTYLKRSGGNYTGLTAEDATRLEKLINYPDGYLAPHSSFWDTFAIKLGVKELILNTDKPEDELKYLFLKGHKRVANSIAEMNASTDYVMFDGNSEAEESNKLNKIKRDAYRALDKLSIEDMRKCLRLYGMKSDTMSNELVESKMAEELERAPAKFITIWVDNKDKEFNFVIEEALSKNVLRKSRTSYYYGTDMIGNSLDDAIAYLKDKKNNDIYMVILNEIKSK